MHEHQHQQLNRSQLRGSGGRYSGRHGAPSAAVGSEVAAAGAAATGSEAEKVAAADAGVAEATGGLHDLAESRMRDEHVWTLLLCDACVPTDCVLQLTVRWQHANKLTASRFKWDMIV